MEGEIRATLDKIPVIKQLVRFFDGIRLPGFEGLSIYDLLEIYVLGIFTALYLVGQGPLRLVFLWPFFP